MSAGTSLLAIAALAVESLGNEELQTVTRNSKSDSQQSFVVVTALGDIPGLGGRVFEVMVKSDGTEGILYEKRQPPKFFAYADGKVVFKIQQSREDGIS